MNVIRCLLVKEFKQIFRNRIIVAMVMGVPVMQLLVLPFAADFEIKNLRLAVVDLDHSDYSRQLISQIPASGYFQLTGYAASYHEALRLIDQDKADLVIEIPAYFEKNLVREKHQDVFIAANAINGTTAGLGTSYLKAIIAAFNQQIRIRIAGELAASPDPATGVTFSNWYNPDLNYKRLMVPGILAMLVTLIGGFLSSLNVVREKETGTIEQINVTPIRKYQFIIGKLLPFWVLGLVVFSLGLVISWLVYGIIPLGSLWLLYGFTALYLVAVLGFGLLVSTFCQTQQQAMFVMFFFLMIFILMSGLFTSVDVMPRWAKVVVAINPLSYLIEVMRMIILKGTGLSGTFSDLKMIALFAVALNGLAILGYKKTR